MRAKVFKWTRTPEGFYVAIAGKLKLVVEPEGPWDDNRYFWRVDHKSGKTIAGSRGSAANLDSAIVSAESRALAILG